jgi:hypothetical protein
MVAIIGDLLLLSSLPLFPQMFYLILNAHHYTVWEKIEMFPIYLIIISGFFGVLVVGIYMTGNIYKAIKELKNAYETTE